METVTLPDGRSVKLGCNLPKARPTALRFAAYFDPAAMTTPPPASVDYTPKAKNAIVQMYGNDQYGDCVIASKMHKVGIWTGNETGSAAIGTTSEAIAQYHAICGPGDNGCNVTDVLDYMQSHGIIVGGVSHKIDGYVAVDWTNKLELQVAIYLFGACDLAVNLPGGWESSNVWDVTNSGIVGGHCIPTAAYDDQGITILTWGGTRLMTWAAVQSQDYMTECYAILSPDWYSNNHLSPMGVDVSTLQSDLAKIKGGGIPDIAPIITPGNWTDFA